MRRDAAPAPAMKSASRAMRGSAEGVTADADASLRDAPAGMARPAILSAAREAALTPERWLAYIIDLRRAGEHAAAGASLVRFRARHPDEAVPAQANSQQTAPSGGIK
jgi:hypothetical protein